MEITPAILAHGVEDARAMAQHPVCLAAGRIHLDVLDGTLFGAHSVWRPEEIGPLPPGITLELHLMVADPQPAVIAWRAAHAGALHAIYHAESPRLQLKHLDAARSMGCACGIALSPTMPAYVVQPYLLAIDEVLVMGVEPGAAGQAFLGEHVWSQAARVRALAPNVPDRKSVV